MNRFIEPTTDFGFKKLFGEEKSKSILKSFLFHILKLESPIAEITFMKQEQLPDSSVERVGVYDIFCIDEKGSRFIVEMQRGSQIFYKDRLLYYSTFPIYQQAKKGEWNYQLNPVYCVGVLGFRLEEDDRYFRRVKLCDIDTHEVFYDKLTFVFVELPKFNKELNELKDHADRWFYFLKHLSELNEVPEELSDEEEMKDAFRIAEISAMTVEERDRYETSLKHLRDAYSVIETARIKGLTEGRAEGITEGRAEGRADGLIEGEIRTLLSFTELRFGKTSEFIEKKLHEIRNEDILLDIKKLILNTSSLQELEQAIIERVRVGT
ncbi:Rpn family recombination-promoting nuclease/putative transposase [bacterium]|nr:Rpn family recombination-promoting nuclease/putative transposase [bacterium]